MLLFMHTVAGLIWHALCTKCHVIIDIRCLPQLLFDTVSNWTIRDVKYVIFKTMCSSGSLQHVMLVLEF